MTEHLIIDVFNFVHAVRRSDPRAGARDLKALIYELENYSALSDKRMTFVFDGTRYKDEIVATKTTQALFSKPGQTADTVVERFMSGVPVTQRLNWIVVSDDMALKRMAAGMGLRTKSPAELHREVQACLNAKRKSAQSGVPKPFNTPFDNL